MQRSSNPSREPSGARLDAEGSLTELPLIRVSGAAKKKAQDAANEAAAPSASPAKSAAAPHGSAVDADVEGPDLGPLFRKRLWRLVKLGFPLFSGAWWLAIVAIILVTAAGISTMFVSQLVGPIVEVILNREGGAFTAIFFKAMALIGLVAVGSACGAYAGEWLALNWRRKLTLHLHDLYMRQRKAYAVCRASDVDTPDQRIATDANLFTQTAASLVFSSFSQTSIVSSIASMAALLYFISSVGYAGALVTIGASLLLVIFNYWAMKPLVGLTVGTEKAEGYFRLHHAFIRLNSESIAFYKGEEREGLQAAKAFQAVYSVRRRNIWQQNVPLLAVNIFANTASGIFGAIALLTQVASDGGGLDRTKLAPGTVTNAISACANLFFFTGDLLKVYSRLAPIAGYVHRVGLLMEALEQEQEQEAPQQTSSRSVLQAGEGSLQSQRQPLLDPVLEGQEGEHVGVQEEGGPNRPKGTAWLSPGNSSEDFLQQLSSASATPPGARSGVSSYAHMSAAEKRKSGYVQQMPQDYYSSSSSAATSGTTSGSSSAVGHGTAVATTRQNSMRLRFANKEGAGSSGAEAAAASGPVRSTWAIDIDSSVTAIAGSTMASGLVSPGSVVAGGAAMSSSGLGYRLQMAMEVQQGRLLAGVGSGLMHCEDAVELQNVSISIPDGSRQLVEGISFRVTRGQSLLISGPSGCGKSSILRVLAGLWSPDSGRVKRPLRGSMHNCFFLPQRPYFVMGTLRDNLIYPEVSSKLQRLKQEQTDLLQMGVLQRGSKRSSTGPSSSSSSSSSAFPSSAAAGYEVDGQLLQLLKAVQLGYLLDNLTLDSVVPLEEQLSGGEAQRLGWARMLYHRPAFCLVDEGTSALNVQLERDLMQLALSAGVSFISVGHRPTLRAFHTHELKIRPDGSYIVEQLAGGGAAAGGAGGAAGGVSSSEDEHGGDATDPNLQIFLEERTSDSSSAAAGAGTLPTLPEASYRSNSGAFLSVSPIPSSTSLAAPLQDHAEARLDFVLGQSCDQEALEQGGAEDDVRDSIATRSTVSSVRTEASAGGSTAAGYTSLAEPSPSKPCCRRDKGCCASDSRWNCCGSRGCCRPLGQAAFLWRVSRKEEGSLSQLLWALVSLLAFGGLSGSLSYSAALTSQLNQAMSDFTAQEVGPAMLTNTLGAMGALLATLLGNYAVNRVALEWRKNLTSHSQRSYFTSRVPYFLSVLSENKAADNVDQRISADQDSLVTSWALVVIALFKNIFPIFILGGLIVKEFGFIYVLYCLSYFLGAFVITQLLSMKLPGLQYRQDALEGSFRFGHSRLMNFIESIAFFKGEDREADAADVRLEACLQNYQQVLRWTFPAYLFTQLQTNFVSLVGFGIAGGSMIAMNSLPGGEPLSGGGILQFCTSCANLLGFLSAIPGLFQSASTAFGSSDRVSQAVRAFNAAAAAEKQRMNDGTVVEQPVPQHFPPMADAASAAAAGSSSSMSADGSAVDMDSGHTSPVHSVSLELQNGVIQTPQGRQLYRNLNLKLQQGESLIIVGKSGCGKSSLLRVLAGLWPMPTNAATGAAVPRILRPGAVGRGGLLFLPQKPLVATGLPLRAQLAYPFQVQQLGASDAQLAQMLVDVGLGYLIAAAPEDCAALGAANSAEMGGAAGGEKEGGVDSILILHPRRGWTQSGSQHLSFSSAAAGAGAGAREDEDDLPIIVDLTKLGAVLPLADSLSAGELQKLSFARLFLHMPAFAIEDEATSALSLQDEAAFMERTLALGISIVSVAHRPSLAKYHSLALKLQGEGHFQLLPVPKPVPAAVSRRPAMAGK